METLVDRQTEHLVAFWNDEAEMNDSVESEALVMPSSNACAVACVP